MSGKKQLDKGWIVAIIFLALFVISFFMGMSNPNLAEPIMKAWVILGAIAFVIVFIVRIIRIRRIFK